MTRTGSSLSRQLTLNSLSFAAGEGHGMPGTFFRVAQTLQPEQAQESSWTLLSGPRPLRSLTPSTVGSTSTRPLLPTWSSPSPCQRCYLLSSGAETSRSNFHTGHPAPCSLFPVCVCIPYVKATVNVPHGGFDAVIILFRWSQHSRAKPSSLT